MDSRPGTRSHARAEWRFSRRAWAVTLAGWLAVWLLLALAATRDLQNQGASIGLVVVLRYGLPSLILMIVSTPVVLYSVARFPIPPVGSTQNLLVHATASVTWVLLETALGQTVNQLTAGQPFDAARVAQGIRGTDLALDLLLYWCLVGIGAAWHQVTVRAAEQQASAALALRNSQLESQLTTSRLRSLQARFHPHFAGNAMNAVVSLIRSGRSEEAISVLAKVAALMREALSNEGPTMVPLAREVAMVDRYLDVERIRFGERLAVSTSIEANAVDLAVPSLLLQPLVENTVVHGVAKTDRPVHLRIVAERHAERLLLRVLDDGPGLPADWDESRWGYGLRYTAARLEAAFGSAAAVTISKAAHGSGVVAEISMPIVREVDGR